MHYLYLIPLLGPMLWFAYKYYIDFYQFDRKRLSWAQLIPLISFLAYLVFLAVYGIEGSIDLFADESRFSRGLLTFFLPGIGFACAVFPTQASEISSKNFDIARAGVYGWFRIVGWVILIGIALRHLLVFSVFRA